MNVKIARIKKGLTQKQLRELCGINNHRMVAIEKGHIENCPFGLLIKIADVLEIPFEELFLEVKL